MPYVPPIDYSDLRDLGSVPIIGPWAARMGYAIDVFATPCSPTPLIWYEAEASALIHAAASVIKPFNMAETFSALTRRGRRHGFKKLAGGFSGRGLGYLNALEELAPFAKFRKNPYIGALFVAEDLLLKYQWYLLLADVTGDFFVNWITQAYQYAGCIPTGAWYCEGHTSGALYLDGLPWALTQNDNHIASGGTMYVPPGYEGYLYAQINFVPWHPDLFGDHPFPEMWITINGEKQGFKHQGTVFDDATQTGNAYARARTKGSNPEGTLYNINFHNSRAPDGFADITSGIMQGQVAKSIKSQLLPDP